MPLRKPAQKRTQKRTQKRSSKRLKPKKSPIKRLKGGEGNCDNAFTELERLQCELDLEQEGPHIRWDRQKILKLEIEIAQKTKSEDRTPYQNILFKVANETQIKKYNNENEEYIDNVNRIQAAEKNLKKREENRREREEEKNQKLLM